MDKETLLAIHQALEKMIERIRAAWRGMSPIRRVGILLLGIALLIALVGYSSQHGGLYLGEAIGNVLGDFYGNASIEFVSIAITVLIIDTLVQRRETEREKKDLILQMGSPDSSFAREAVRKLRTRGWLDDASLLGAILREANLRWANLGEANLSGATLSEANLTKANLREANLGWANLIEANLERADLERADLRGAKVTAEQLAQAERLKGAIMPDGTIHP